MKTLKNILLAISLLMLSLYSCDNEKIIRTRLMETKTTFTVPISSISQSTSNNQIIYIGLDNGNVIVKNGDNQSIINAGNNRIYDVYEYTPDSIFIGVRDEGLKLFTKDTLLSYKIESKEKNYGVYSIAADTAGKKIYVGTSNGCYYLNLREKENNEYLHPLSLTANYYSGVSKVLFEKDALIMAADSGLYIYKNDRVHQQRKNIMVNNIVIKDSLLYALYNDSIAVIELSSFQTKEIKGKGNKIYSLDFPDNNENSEWQLSKNKILYKKQGKTYQYEIPDISVKGKNISLLTQSYYYIACNEEMLMLPVNQQITGQSNNILAVSEKRDNDTYTYFLTDDLYLHRYLMTGGNNRYKSENLGKITGISPIKDDVIKFVWDNNRGYLATDKCLYEIKNRKAKCIKRFDDAENNDFRTLLLSVDNPQKLYTGKRKDLGYVDISAKTDSVKPIPVRLHGEENSKDVYVIDLKENNNELYFLTLNKGLFKLNTSTFENEEFLHAENYGSSKNMAINANNLYLCLSEGVYKYNIESDSITKIPGLDPKNIRSIHCDSGSNGMFILYYHGFSFCRIDDFNNKELIATDIPFHKSKIALYQNKALLGSRFGLFEYDKGKINPITVEKANNYGFLLTIIFSLAIILTIIGIYVYFQKKRKKQRDKDKRQLQEIKEEINELENLIFNYQMVKKSDIRHACEGFVNKHPELKRLPFMQKKGEDSNRYYLAVMFLCVELKPKIMADALGIADIRYVNRVKFAIREAIDKLYTKQPETKKIQIINLLYNRIKNSKENDEVENE